MKKIYIAGPVSGHDKDFTWAKFEEAEKHLRIIGHQPFNPLKFIKKYNDRRKEFGLPELTDDKNRAQILLILMHQLAQCDIIYLLDGASSSSGAVAETYFHTALGKKTMLQNKSDYHGKNKDFIKNC